MISLMGGVAIGILTYTLLMKPLGDLLEKPLSDWLPVIIGLVAAFVGRYLIILLERLWIRTLVRRAERRRLEQIAEQIEESKQRRGTAGGKK